MRLMGNCYGHIPAPGQFVDIAIPGFYLRRPISVCDADNLSITLIYKTIGGGTEALSRMKEGDTVEVVSDASTETILYAEMPVKTQLKIVYTEPGLKGDTATNTLKPAKLETGVEVRVPLFINEGEIIEVDMRDGSYVNRLKA